MMPLPFWFSQEQVENLAAAARNWFQLLKGWASWPLMQMDTEKCSEGVLNLIAWQRDISRFDGEPLGLFRKRVKYAYANARDAGSGAGFKRIFERLGVGYVELEERMPGRDWDIIAIRMSDSQLAQNQALLDVLIQHYGRTCRRYEWTTITSLGVGVRALEFGHNSGNESASVPPCVVAIRVGDFGSEILN